MKHVAGHWSNVLCHVAQCAVQSRLLPRMIRERCTRRAARIFDLSESGEEFVVKDRIMHVPLVIRHAAASSIGRAVFWCGLNTRAIDGESIPVWLYLAQRAKFCFDIGANIGIYGLTACCVNPQLRVWAFEPNSGPFKLLRENVSANSFGTNFSCEQLAVSDYDGGGLLHLSSAGDTASLRADFRQPTGQVEVRVCTLDTFVRKRGIHRVDLIKIDTEATEDRVLKGACNLLERDGPDIICEVLKGRTERFLNQFLKRFGYRYYWMTQKGLVAREEIVGDPSYRFLNYFFSKRKTSEISALCRAARSSMTARCISRSYSLFGV